MVYWRLIAKMQKLLAGWIASCGQVDWETIASEVAEGF